jgi:peptidoglycan-associated lipoprotein
MNKLIPVALISGLLLAGCASSGSSETQASTPPPPPTQPAEAPKPAPVPMPSENVVYFEFDSTALNDTGRKVIAAYGRYLSANPSVRVRLEGHTDERGSREYNVGLGERRAVAVQQQLLSAGASARQLSVTSFGEERPAATGSNASAWAKNRRVEIVRQ